MKLRSITLRNVRRFQNTTATISGIADGITTICAPNESGKSTFFDALHAIFFYPHGGQSQEIKSLQPYSKGPVEISVDVDDDQGLPWRIEKRYLASKSAVITDLSSGRIHAQADEAEEWIRKLVGADMHGPAGLLWVRQGISGFGPGGSGTREKTEREKLRETRQNLMSSVAGQIDNVTGGRRMDDIMKACEADLDALATKTGSPKAGGEWSKAVKQVEELEALEARLSAQVAELSEALGEHADLKRSLDNAEDQAAIRARDAAIRQAEINLEAAASHEAKIAAGRRDLRLSDLEAQGHRDRISTSDAAIQGKRDLEEALQKAKDAARSAEGEATRLQKEMDQAKAGHVAAQEALRQARSDLSHAHAREDAARTAKRRGEIENLLAKVTVQEEKRKEASAFVRNNPVTPDAISDLEKIARTLSTARATRDAGAAALCVNYSGSMRLSSGGADLPGDTSISLTKQLDIDMPGIGHLVLTPAIAAAGADPEAVSRELDARLAELGADSLDHARTMARDRQDFSAREDFARQAIEALVPDGTDVLRRELEDLPSSGEEPSPDETEDLSVIKGRVASLESEEREAARVFEDTRRDHAAAVEVVAGTRVEERIALEQVQTAPQGILTDEERASEAAALAAAEARSEELRQEIERLEEAAPDKEALDAELTRLVSARDNSARERERQRNRLHELGGIIRARAEDDAESRLAETSGALEKARSREQRYRFDVQALSELRDHLEAARKEARDAYFEPVKKEMGPLLSMLHDDATIEMDSDTMLPARIVRDGIAEDIDVLSGGASEQIAILTRLAFARLYAQSGKQIPIILDDALVHSDDDRIIRMFTALTRIAKDQQVVVFSCRTRAFSELGGTRCPIEIRSDIMKAV